MTPEDLETVAKNPFVAGAAGASVFALKYMPGSSWIEKLINIFCGALTAGFVAPALIEYLEINSKGMASVITFVVGLLGLSFIAAVLQGLKDVQMGEVFRGLFTSVIDSWVGAWSNRRNRKDDSQ